MDCKQSELAMMQHFEKNIHPKIARKLAKHVLTCQNCRELFLLMDESAEEFELTEAPSGFTRAVMARVNEAAVYTRQEKPVFAGIWGLVAILAGAMLIIVANTDVIGMITGGYPLMDGVMYWLGNAAANLRQGVDGFLQSGSDLDLDGWISVGALALSIMLIGLLAVLYKDDAAAAGRTA